MKRKETPISITKPVVEIRFKEDPKVLDNRGKWADITSNKFGFKDWAIQENRIDLFNQKNHEIAFFSFRNMGFLSESAKSLDEFGSKAIAFIEFLASDSMLGSKLHIKRIGIRTNYCIEYDKDFTLLKERINDNLGGLNPKARTMLNVDLEDIASIFDLSDDNGNIHLVCGPMRENQLQQHFKKYDRLPSVALFVDIDYWTQPDALIETRKLVQHIKGLLKAEEEKIGSIVKVVIGENLANETQGS